MDIKFRLCCISPYIRGNDRTVPDENHAGLYMNNALFSILCGFPSCKINDNLYRFSITNNFNDNIIQVQNVSSMPSISTGVSTMSIPISTYTDFIQTHMEYDSTVLMSPILSLVFLSNHIPISYTQDTPPMIIDSSSNNNSIMSLGNISSSSNIMTDFVIDWADITSYNGVVQYTATKYRLVDLIGNGDELKEISFSVYWSTEDGSLKQVYINGGNNCTLKVMFRKKNY